MKTGKNGWDCNDVIVVWGRGESAIAAMSPHDDLRFISREVGRDMIDAGLLVDVDPRDRVDLPFFLLEDYPFINYKMGEDAWIVALAPEQVTPEQLATDAAVVGYALRAGRKENDDDDV